MSNLIAFSKKLWLIICLLAFFTLGLYGQEILLTPDEAIILAKIETYLSFIGQPIPSSYYYYPINDTYGSYPFEDHLKIVGVEYIEILAAYEKIKEIRVIFSFRENRDVFSYWYNSYGAVAEKYGFTRFDYLPRRVGYFNLENYNRILLEDWSRPEDEFYMGRITFSNGY